MAALTSETATSSSKKAIDSPLPVAGSTRWYASLAPAMDFAASMTHRRSSSGIGSQTAIRANIAASLGPTESHDRSVRSWPKERWNVALPLLLYGRSPDDCQLHVGRVLHPGRL